MLHVVCHWIAGLHLVVDVPREIINLELRVYTDMTNGVREIEHSSWVF